MTEPEATDPHADAVFAPPEDDDASATSPTATIAAWMLAGTAVGTALGSALQLIGGIEEAMTLGIGGCVVGGLLGVGAYALERRLSAGRPALHDGSGRMTRPLRPWLLAVPLAFGVAGLLALVVVGTVHTGSAWVGLAFLILALGFTTATRPLWSSYALTRAVELAEEGRSADAERRLLRLFRSPWATAASRAQAALNLGLLSLVRGDLTAAARWYTQPRRGRTRAFARAGLALVRVLQGEHADAEVALREADAGGRTVQREVDGVRLLLVLRRDGPAAARALGDRLASDESGALFLGVLAASRRADGDADGARALLDTGLADALRGSGLAGAVPELRALIDVAP